MDLTLGIKLVVLLIPLFCYLCETWQNKEIRGSFRKRYLPAASIVVAVLSCFLVYNDSREAKAAKADAAKLRDELNAKMDQIGGLAGNREMAEKYIKEARENNAAYANGSTESAIDAFFATKDKRQAFRQDAAKINENAVLNFRVRYQPICDFVLDKTEAMAAGVNRRGAKIDINPGSRSNEVAGTKNGGSGLGLTFQNGARVLLQVYPASFENGNEVGGLHIQFLYFTAGGAPYQLWAMDANGESYNLHNPRPSALSFQNRSGHLMSPNEDMVFKDAMNRSLEEVMGFLIDDTGSVR